MYGLCVTLVCASVLGLATPARARARGGQRWVSSAHVEDGAEYDFVVVGAGSGGATVAARLAGRGAGRGARVLLLEAGGNPPRASVVPGLLGSLTYSSADWNYHSVRGERAGAAQRGGRAPLTRGKMLGGCSSINSMMYTRGNPEDFNEWARMGCENWDWDTVYPYFLKSEGYEGPELSDPNFAAYHNTEGPMKVTKQRFNDPNVDLKLDVLLQSLQEIGINSIEDYNGPTQFGISRGYFMHSAPPGVRSSTAECFLRGGRGGGGAGGAGAGLHVLKHALATRVLLRGAAAVGVELTRHNKTLHVFATKEVILSAGAIGTPRLLLASGIGRRDDLERLNVKQIVDLPVGYDLQDHLIVPIAFTGAPTSFVDQQNPNPKYSLDYFPYPRLNGFFSVSDWSRPQLQLSPYYFNQSSPLVFKALNNSLNYVEGVVEPIQKANADSEIFMMCLILLHPKSRGRIVYHSVDPLAAPDIYLGYLTHDDDLSIMREGIKKMLRLTESRYFSGWGARAVRLQLPTCAGLEYGSDEYWECYALALARTVWHQAGTARAGGAGGVLDAALRVRGLQRLRVVDASALPAMPSGNTHATVMMLAERAADLIKEEYYG